MARNPGRGGAVTAITGTGRTLGAAADAFLSVPRPDTTARTYAGTLERLGDRLGQDRPYDSAARAEEVPGLDVPDLDLANRQARARVKGGDTHLLPFQTAAARLLSKLTAGRESGPVFLTERRAASHRVTAAADLDPESGRARLSYEMAISGHKQLSTWRQYVKPSQDAVARLMADTDPDRRRR